jgi:hypothetical protein
VRRRSYFTVFIWGKLLFTSGNALTERAGEISIQFRGPMKMSPESLIRFFFTHFTNLANRVKPFGAVPLNIDDDSLGQQKIIREKAPILVKHDIHNLRNAETQIKHL